MTDAPAASEPPVRDSTHPRRSAALAPSARAAASARLRAETAAEHRAAEESRFIVELLDGHLPVEAYAALAAQHLVVYAALEARASGLRSSHPELLDRRLDRRDRLARDLRALHGPRWEQAAAASTVPATLRYAARIRDADRAGFFGQHYVRVLGDLSGGQLVRMRLRAVFPAAPVSFYDFTSLGPLGRWKERYRSGLDATFAELAAVDEVVAEAVVAFAANREVFDELGAQFC